MQLSTVEFQCKPLPTWDSPGAPYLFQTIEKHILFIRTVGMQTTKSFYIEYVLTSLKEGWVYCHLFFLSPSLFVFSSFCRSSCGKKSIHHPGSVHFSRFLQINFVFTWNLFHLFFCYRKHTWVQREVKFARSREPWMWVLAA